jgi:hypothetical protein
MVSKLRQVRRLGPPVGPILTEVLEGLDLMGFGGLAFPPALNIY